MEALGRGGGRGCLVSRPRPASHAAEFRGALLLLAWHSRAGAREPPSPPARRMQAPRHPDTQTPRHHPPSKREKSSSSPSTARQAASTVRRPAATPAFSVGTSMHRGLKLQAGEGRAEGWAGGTAGSVHVLWGGRQSQGQHNTQQAASRQTQSRPRRRQLFWLHTLACQHGSLGRCAGVEGVDVCARKPGQLVGCLLGGCLQQHVVLAEAVGHKVVHLSLRKAGKGRRKERTWSELRLMGQPPHLMQRNPQAGARPGPQRSAAQQN